MTVKFAKLTEQEWSQAEEIAERASITLGYPVLNTMMDLSAVHAHTPLDLAGLSEAPVLDFVHDIAGIRRYIDRDTGELTECFVPRYAR